MGSFVYFGLLGPVQAWVGEREVPLGGARARAVLACLLVEPNRVVSLDAIVAGAWGAEALTGTRFQAQNRMSALRRALREAGGAESIDTAGAGYVIRVGPEQLDARRFTDQVQAARDLSAGADLAAAAQAAAGALALWRGPALHGLSTPRLRAEAQRWDEARLAAQELLFDIELRRGRHQEIVGDLLNLVAEHPWRERLAAQLMLALHRAGRRAEALDAFERVRHQLAAELGIDPGQDLVRLRDQILREDPALAPSHVDTEPIAVPAPRPVGPRMLPRMAPHFVGREPDLAQLDAASRDAGTVTVTTIVGPPGVGKTALAVSWAHRAGDEFPDGQLFLHLRGHGPGRPLRPIEGLTSLLLGLGVPAEQIPGDEDAAVGRYRSRLAGQRVLLILDNAADADQVRPLLPPGPGSVVVVTSRERLTGLTALDGARPLALGLLDRAEAVALLRAILGPARTAAEVTAVGELASVCGGLPLALRIAAAQLVEQAGRTIASHVADLRRGRLAGLTVTDDESAAVRPALASSYGRLDPDAQRLFGRLGLVPAPDISVESAAVLMDSEVGPVAEWLELLVAAHLVERRSPDRFGLHDLIREYAVEVVERDEAAPVRQSVVLRYAADLVDRADAASRVAFPGGLRLLDPARDGAGDGFRDRGTALSWIDQELPSLIAVAGTAAAVGDPELAPRLADALRAYFWLRHDSTHWRELARFGLAAATEAGDRRGQAATTFSLGMAELNVSRYDEAVVLLRQALALSRSLAWPEAQAAVLGNLGIAYSERHDVPRAIESYRQALAVNTTLGRTTGRANNLGNLGLLQVRVGQFRAAAEHLAEAVAVHKGLGGGFHAMVFGHGLGQAEWTLGRFEDARAHLEEALSAVRELDDVEMESLILTDLALLHLDLGQLERARELAETALRLVADVTDADVRATVLAGHATATAASGGIERADREAQQAVSAAVESGNPVTWVAATVAASSTAVRVGRPAAAREQAESAVERARSAGLRDLEAIALTARARARLALGEPAEADALRAASLHRETGHRLGEVRALLVADRAAGPGRGHRQAALDILAALPGPPDPAAILLGIDPDPVIA